AKEPWTPDWFALLLRARRALGDGWEVVVLTDRGLESAELFRHIRDHGGHPLMRVKAAGTFRPAGGARRYPMRCFAPRPGRPYAAGRGAYAPRPLGCRPLGSWGDRRAAPGVLPSRPAPRRGAARVGG